MIIGTFHSAHDGYIGYIVTLSFGRLPVVIVPHEKTDFSFDILFVNADDETTIKFGTAQRRNGKHGGYLKICMDCPALSAPIEAIMQLKPSRDGVYTLDWERSSPSKRKR